MSEFNDSYGLFEIQWKYDKIERFYNRLQKASSVINAHREQVGGR
jgi:hypothetical protein